MGFKVGYWRFIEFLLSPIRRSRTPCAPGVLPAVLTDSRCTMRTGSSAVCFGSGRLQCDEDNDYSCTYRRWTDPPRTGRRYSTLRIIPPRRYATFSLGLEATARCVVFLQHDSSSSHSYDDPNVTIIFSAAPSPLTP
jgi:hypothetical protein